MAEALRFIRAALFVVEIFAVAEVVPVIYNSYLKNAEPVPLAVVSTLAQSYAIKTLCNERAGYDLTLYFIAKVAPLVALFSISNFNFGFA